MHVRTLVSFFDIKAGVDRRVGEEFIVDEGRFSQINAVGYEKVGAPLVDAVDRDEPKPEPAPKRQKRPTKAELLAEAEELGVDVPEGATNPQIAKLIAEAKGGE